MDKLFTSKLIDWYSSAVQANLHVQETWDLHQMKYDWFNNVSCLYIMYLNSCGNVTDVHLC